MQRRNFLKTTAVTGVGVALQVGLLNAAPLPKVTGPLAISMWDFSWLERRWPGAGYEDWDLALSQLKARGYNAVRIDAYPHLIFNNPDKEYLLKPVWTTQDWGSPAIIKVNIQPHLINFLKKCRQYKIKVGLSAWWREDEDKSFSVIKSPEKLGEVWLSVLDLVQQHGLLDQLLYVDLSNEWPIKPWTPFNQELGWWDTSAAILWMRQSIAVLRAKYPMIPYTFSFTGEITPQIIGKGDLSMLDLLDPHIWMTSSYGGEFYKTVGYNYELFDNKGYDNLALKGEKLYREKENYWKEGLLKQIEVAAEWSRQTGLPLITTECWGIVDYKDWPLLQWDWVKELCALGTNAAAKTGRWAAIATSNFCGPQFNGMWRDKAWHKKLTGHIKSSSVEQALQSSKLIRRL